MRNTTHLLCASLLAIAAAAGVARAQVPPSPPGGPGMRPGAAALLKKVETARILMLSQVLGLDARTSLALEAAIDPFDVEYMAAMKAQGALRKQLRALAADPAATAAQVQAVLEGLAAGRAKIQDIDARRIRAVEGVLSPSQVAAFVIAMPKVQRRIQQAIRTARKRRRGGGGRGGPWRGPPPPSPPGPPGF